MWGLMYMVLVLVVCGDGGCSGVCGGGADV